MKGKERDGENESEGRTSVGSCPRSIVTPACSLNRKSSQ